MDFYTGLLNLANWSGNVILPTLAGLFFSFAVVCFSKGRDYHQWMYGGFLALMASGLLRMIETFTSQLAWNNPDLFWNATAQPDQLDCQCHSAALRGNAGRVGCDSLRRNSGTRAHRS